MLSLAFPSWSSMQEAEHAASRLQLQDHQACCHAFDTHFSLAWNGRPHHAYLHLAMIQGERWSAAADACAKAAWWLRFYNQYWHQPPDPMQPLPVVTGLHVQVIQIQSCARWEHTCRGMLAGALRRKPEAMLTCKVMLTFSSSWACANLQAGASQAAESFCYDYQRSSWQT